MDRQSRTVVTAVMMLVFMLWDCACWQLVDGGSWWIYKELFFYIGRYRVLQGTIYIFNLFCAVGLATLLLLMIKAAHSLHG